MHYIQNLASGKPLKEQLDNFLWRGGEGRPPINSLHSSENSGSFFDGLGSGRSNAGYSVVRALGDNIALSQRCSRGSGPREHWAATIPSGPSSLNWFENVPRSRCPRDSLPFQPSQISFKSAQDPWILGDDQRSGRELPSRQIEMGFPCRTTPRNRPDPSLAAIPDRRCP